MVKQRIKCWTSNKKMLTGDAKECWLYTNFIEKLVFSFFYLSFHWSPLILRGTRAGLFVCSSIGIYQQPSVRFFGNFAWSCTFRKEKNWHSWIFYENSRLPRRGSNRGGSYVTLSMPGLTRKIADQYSWNKVISVFRLSVK